jgi:cytochrome d ubiquinol oxidase subunit I
MDPVVLSRLQFALTIMFHYLFPPLTIGLGVLLVIVEWLWVKTGEAIYEKMALFWTKIFAVNFALGVSTGIVMEFQFGTNWATYSRFVGDVFGSALAAEGIFAFFLESGFLAVLVFGWERVSKPVHFFSTIMVALGSIFSSIWIVIANSWQQTPAGYHLVTQPSGFVRAEIIDFWGLVFNPSSMTRLSHVLIGAFILGAFFAMSVSAYYIVRDRHLEFSRRTFKIALVYGLIASLLSLVTGHDSAMIVAKHQPAKLAAMEAHFKTGTGGADELIFGIPDTQGQKVDFAVAIPGLLSLMVHGDPSKPVTGLDRFRREDRPPVVIPFFAFHLMVALGMMFISLTVLGSFLLWRGVLFSTKWLMWIYVFAVAGAFAANELGWVAAEVGRQPWAVYGLLRTSKAISKAVPAEHVLISIGLYGLIYTLLFFVWIYVLSNKIQHGPEVSAIVPDTTTRPALLDAAASLLARQKYSYTSSRDDNVRPSQGKSEAQRAADSQEEEQ